MRNVTTSETSLFGLIGQVRDDLKSLIRQEVQLAKTELSEKMSLMGRNAGLLAGGGVAAFAGLILLLAALSSLLSFAFEHAGLSRSFSFFLGALIIGGIVAGVGTALVMKALKTFSHESLAPEKTVHTLKKLKSDEPEAEKPEPVQHQAEPKLSSTEIEANIETTREDMGAAVEEIGERLTPRHMQRVVKRKIQAHPYRSSLIASATGFLGSFMIGRRLRHHGRA